MRMQLKYATDLTKTVEIWPQKRSLRGVYKWKWKHVELAELRGRGLYGGRVRVYILNGQPGQVPIYYFGSQVFLTLCNTRVDRRAPNPPEISVSQHACV